MRAKHIIRSGPDWNWLFGRVRRFEAIANGLFCVRGLFNALPLTTCQSHALRIMCSFMCHCGDPICCGRRAREQCAQVVLETVHTIISIRNALLYGTKPPRVRVVIRTLELYNQDL